MRIVPVPNLEDNYAYLVIDGDRAAIVDPGESAPILAAAAREGVALAAVWATHHHHDHVGGVKGLLEQLPKLEVIAHQYDDHRRRVPGVTRAVEDGDTVALGAVTARIIHNPGHTLGAISWYIEAAGGEPGAVFTGDTMFAAGCGRLFEGTAAQMHQSLTRLAALPPDTRVYFGHEYTASNLRFAAVEEPDNRDVVARAAAVATTRAAGEWTTPSTIADERATNPFVRARDAATLGAIRERKDRFK